MSVVKVSLVHYWKKMFYTLSDAFEIGSRNSTTYLYCSQKIIWRSYNRLWQKQAYRFGLLGSQHQYLQRFKMEKGSRSPEKTLIWWAVSMPLTFFVACKRAIIKILEVSDDSIVSVFAQVWLSLSLLDCIGHIQSCTLQIKPMLQWMYWQVVWWSVFELSWSRRKHEKAERCAWRQITRRLNEKFKADQVGRGRDSFGSVAQFGT